jgi:drug/metabolite transporter (DMT)-like permease
VVAGLAVGLVAVIVLVGWSPLEPTPTTIVAVAFALGAAFSYAVAGSYVRRTMSGVGPLQLATGQLVAAAIVLLPVALLSGPPGAPSAAGATSLIALATVSTAVAWPLFQRVLKRRGSTAASTVTFIVPGFGIVWAALVLGERIGPELVVGFGLLLVSLALVFGLRPPTLVRARLVSAHLAGVARAVAVRL